MSYDGKVFRENYLKAIKKLSGCPTKKPTKDLLSLDFVVWMRYDGKVFREDFIKATKKSSGCPPDRSLLEVNDLGRVNFP